MGLNTTVVVFNDAINEIERDPNFGKNLAAAIRSIGFNTDPISVSAMNHGSAALVIECHHADYDVYVKVGGNSGEVVSHK